MSCTKSHWTLYWQLGFYFWFNSTTFCCAKLYRTLLKTGHICNVEGFETNGQTLGPKIHLSLDRICRWAPSCLLLTSRLQVFVSITADIQYNTTSAILETTYLTSSSSKVQIPMRRHAIFGHMPKLISGWHFPKKHIVMMLRFNLCWNI